MNFMNKISPPQENVVKTSDLSMGNLTTFTAPVQEPLEVSLAGDTLSRLRGWFTFRGLRPSPAMWEGIEDLCVCLECMAEGEAQREFFLSSLAPGAGKNQ